MNELSLAQERVKRYLQVRRFSSIHCLGQGSFGEVLSAVSVKNEKVAIKVIRNEDSWPMEEKMWPKLKHPFILPVLQSMDVAEIDCKLYVMPLHPDCLHEMVQCESFRSDCNALLRLKKWLLEITSALHYLHSNRLCHLDIKPDNVLISRNDSAILCDFSGIHSIGVTIRRFVSPMQFRPPEFFQDNKVDGELYDMWTLGLLALNVLTNHAFSRMMSPFTDEWTWDSDVKILLGRILQAPVFGQLMAEAVPRVRLFPADYALALDFVNGLLRFQSEMRLTADKAGCHAFLIATASKSVRVECCKDDHENSSERGKTTGEQIFDMILGKVVGSVKEEITPVQSETGVVATVKQDDCKTKTAPRHCKLNRILDAAEKLNAVGGATTVDIFRIDDSMKRKLLRSTDAKKKKPAVKFRPPVGIKKRFLKKMSNVFKRKNKYEILKNNFDDCDN